MDAAANAIRFDIGVVVDDDDDGVIFLSLAAVVR
jgi:hypothetical protein